MNDKYYYRFDLNFDGDYICGYCSINENTDFFLIENPTFYFTSPSRKYKIEANDNLCNLAKRCVVCFYKINN